MNENQKMTIGLGRGSNPASRANLRKPKIQWVVLEQQSPNGRWIRFAGPMTQRKAYTLVSMCNEAVRGGTIKGAICYCAMSQSAAAIALDVAEQQLGYERALAQQLGRMGKGKPKNYTQAELMRRRERLSIARNKRWA